MTRSSFVALSFVLFTAAPGRAEPCELATPKACLDKGLELLEAGDPASVGFFMRACESMLPDACAQVGFLYMGGSSVLARDDVQARVYAELGCEHGSGLGCHNAAILVRDGRGGPPDHKVMRGFAERSCELGHADGCYLLGAIYEEGVGVKPDQKKANQLLDKACELGDARSCAIMATRHDLGERGAKKDGKLAAARYARACELGHGEACNDLGVAIHEGKKGFPAGDLGAAHERFVRSCELGYAQGCTNRDIAAKALAERGATSGTTALAVVSRSGRKVVARHAGGPALVVGAAGEVSKEVSQMGFTMNLVIGTVKVTALAGEQVELEVVADQSEIVIDGKKVDHWTAGTALALKWKAP